MFFQVYLDSMEVQHLTDASALEYFMCLWKKSQTEEMSVLRNITSTFYNPIQGH